MTRKLISFVLIAAFAIGSIVAVPVAVTAHAPPDPGIASTEHVKHTIQAPEAAAVVAPAERHDRARPSVVVYNLRTCEVKTPDGSGRLVSTNMTGHRAFAVPWLRCNRN